MKFSMRHVPSLLREYTTLYISHHATAGEFRMYKWKSEEMTRDKKKNEQNAKTVLFKEDSRWNNDVIRSEKPRAHSFQKQTKKKQKSESHFANLKVNWVECSWPIYLNRFNPEIYKQNTRFIGNSFTVVKVGTWTHKHKTPIQWAQVRKRLTKEHKRQFVFFFSFFFKNYQKPKFNEFAASHSNRFLLRIYKCVHHRNFPLH